MINNATTARLPLRDDEHAGILAAAFLGVAYVGENVAIINRMPQARHIPTFAPIRR